MSQAFRRTPKPSTLRANQATAVTDLHPRVEIVRRLHRAVLKHLHLVEQVTVVGFVHVHHFLHGLGRQANLVSHHAGAFCDPLMDVDQLDLIGIDHIDAGICVGQRGDRDAAALGLSEVGSQLVTHLDAEH